MGWACSREDRKGIYSRIAFSTEWKFDFYVISILSVAKKIYALLENQMESIVSYYANPFPRLASGGNGARSGYRYVGFRLVGANTGAVVSAGKAFESADCRLLLNRCVR